MDQTISISHPILLSAILAILSPLTATAAAANATLAVDASSTTFARVFANHMVLQRNEPVNLYGHDSVNSGGQAITITFAGQTKNTTTDGDGNWMVKLDPLTANATGQDLVATGSSVKTLTDVLIGEVWLAAGQSNMDHNVQTSLDVNKPNPAYYPLIRMCNWQGTVSTGRRTVYNAGDFANLTPENFYSGTWKPMDASAVLPQSAVAYYFAQYLVASLNIPVGIIDISRGGTSTEAFISPTTHLNEPRLKDAFERPHLSQNLGQWTGPRIYKNVYNNNVNGGNYTHTDPTNPHPHPHPFAPGFLSYTGVTHIADFTFKGALWYQGESNAEFTSGKYKINGNQLSDNQTFVMKTLVADWRATFNKPNLPFYIVQLTRINAPNRVLWPYYREAQQRVATDIDGVEITLVMESGTNGPNVHPHEKEIIGMRLAKIARAKEYAQNITHGGPTYKSHTVSGNKIILKFNHIGSGLTDHDGGKLRNFLIAGKDQNFVAATATIVNNTVEVTAAGVVNPIAVRHAWHMNIDVDLFNADGFSSSSFRTDR